MRSSAKILSALWRWSLVVTLPVAVLFGVWCVRTAERYQALGVRYETLGDYVRLHNVGTLEARQLVRHAELALRPRTARAPGGLRRVDLFLPESSRRKLNSDLPHSGRDYVQGALAYPDGDIWEVSLRYRGDFFWHWAGDKKSLRVKTKKKHLYDRMRAFNLIAPKSTSKLTGHLGYVLARRMGLITPESDLVEVSVNADYRGVHHLVEQPDEMTLRKNDRMPGDLYAGELVARDRYRGLEGRLFENPGAWEKVAINNHFPPETDDALQLLSELLCAPRSRERTTALRELLDIEAFGRFAAYRVLVQSDHFDDTHNWRLYYDPWRNVFEPLVWDPDAWHPGWIPKPGQDAREDIVSSVLDEVLMQDSTFVVARQAALESYFGDGAHEDFLDEARELAARSRRALEADPALMRHLDVERPAEVLQAQEELLKAMRAISDDLSEAYLSKSQLRWSADAADPGTLRFEVQGRRPFRSVALGFERPLEGVLSAEMAWWDRDGRHAVDVSGALVQSGARLVVDVPLVAQFRVSTDPQRAPRLRRQVRVMPATYELVLSGAALEGNRIVDVAGVHAPDASVGAERVEPLEPRPFLLTFGVVEPRPRVAPEIWSGTLRLAGVETVTRDVVIEPGTTILMEPGATRILEGKLLARGREDAPIRVLPAAAGQEPWGAIALRGHGARGSELAWWEMSGGSGHKVPLAEYSAMLSIHDVPEVLVRHSRFADSHVVDDMVHAVYSNVRFEDCEFRRSLFDAVDLDICDGLVLRCRFEESGNDALDLMTSRVVVRETVLAQSGDKGASVGEDTTALLIDVALHGNAIGVQPKDRSRAVLYNCELTGNGMALDAYKKNWRYDSGGFAYLYKCRLEENASLLTADKFSTIRIYDSFVDAPIVADRRVLVDPTVDSGSRREARDTGPFRFREEAAEAVDLFNAHWSHADPRIRGRHEAD